MPIVAQTPPVTTPVIERITQHIVDSLETMTIANGYSKNAVVQQPNPGIGNSLIDGRVIVVMGDATEQDDRPMHYKEWVQEFLIVAECRQSEDAVSRNIDTLRNLRRSEIEWCLTHDSDGTREQTTRGGLAQDTLLWEPIIVPVPPNAHEGQIVVRVGVLYRTLYNNPFASSSD
jgi:hypothetical protein